MSSSLLLQKQIALDDKPEQLLHSVVIGSQWDSPFLEEHEFVVGQAAADSITDGVVPGVRWLDTALHSIGRHPKTPWQRVDRWYRSLPEAAWTTLNVRDGEKGPLEIEVTLCRVQARTLTGGTGPDELPFITRERQSDGTLKHNDYLSNAEATAPLGEFARVAKAEHRIEECFHRGKSDAGLGDYQVRNWIGWQHHQTLSLIAAWFLNEETRQGKNPNTRHDGPSSPPTDRR